MSESYTIEPPVERQRELSRDRKLDRILDILVHRDEPEQSDGDDDAPEVSFEADPDSLPTEPSDEEPTDEADNGEGTENVAQPVARSGFRHPSLKRRALVDGSA